MNGMTAQKKEVFERIRHLIGANDVVLYLKGSAAFPQCGFSAAMVQMLDNLGVRYTDVDVLSDSTLREGIKAYASWPMTPQLYIKGEFIGGCDIVREMYVSGELESMFRGKGLL